MGTKQVIPGHTGIANCLIVLINDAGEYYSTVASDTTAYVAGNIADYGLTATEDGDSGNYQITIPATVPAGIYSVQAFDAAAATLAESDMAARVATGSLDWDGVSLTPVIYFPKVNFARNDTTDEYTVVWQRGDTPLTSGVTSPTIAIADRSDWSALLAATAMTALESGSGVCKYDATGDAQLGASGSAVVTLTATIDGTVRTRICMVGSTGTSEEVIADAVWDELRASHVIVGSFGEANQTSSSIDVSISYSFGGTGYCTRSDINDIFGTNNVTTWADLDSDADADNISAHIARGIAWATTEINDRLRGGPYEIPLPATVAATITDICATLAGVWLYRSRGTDDETEIDKYKWHWQRCETTLSEIRAGKRRLDATSSTETGGQAPFAV